jgi:hypothetical protein
MRDDEFATSQLSQNLSETIACGRGLGEKLICIIKREGEKVIETVLRSVFPWCLPVVFPLSFLVLNPSAPLPTTPPMSKQPWHTQPTGVIAM